MLAVGLTALALRLFLPPVSWFGVSLAAAIALTTQLVLYVALRRVRRDPKRFAVGVVAGAATRMVVLLGAIIWLALSPTAWAVPFLLALTVYLVALLLFESVLENLDLMRPRAAHP